MTALITALMLSQSPNVDAEIFVDRGESYIRAGSLNGLRVGAGLDVIDARSRQPAGGAVVMETWESLSRISLDSKASAHTPLKIVRVSKPAAAEQPSPAPAPSAVAPPIPLPIPMPPAPVPSGQPLIGHVSMHGAGDLRRIIIHNSSRRDWHNCDARLPNNKHYRFGDLEADESEGIMLFRFEYDSPQAWARMDGVTVVCNEGVGRFAINL